MINDLKIITGRAKDYGGSGITHVEICLMRNFDEYYWNGNEWLIEKSLLKTKGMEIWSYDSSKVEWTANEYYTIIIRAVDRAGNIEMPEESTTFMFDNEPPSISANNEMKISTRHENGTSHAILFVLLLSAGFFTVIDLFYNHRASFGIHRPTLSSSLPTLW